MYLFVLGLGLGLTGWARFACFDAAQRNERTCRSRYDLSALSDVVLVCTFPDC